LIFEISIISIFGSSIFLFILGIIIFENQSFEASLILFSICIGVLIFPVREISHKKSVFLGMILFVFELIIEAQILRSIPGSSILSPLDILQ